MTRYATVSAETTAIFYTGHGKLPAGTYVILGPSSDESLLYLKDPAVSDGVAAIAVDPHDVNITIEEN